MQLNQIGGGAEPLPMIDPTAEPPRKGGGKNANPPKMDDAVNLALRQMHSSIASEDLPDELAAILRQIDDKLEGKEAGE